MAKWKIQRTTKCFFPSVNRKGCVQGRLWKGKIVLVWIYGKLCDVTFVKPLSFELQCWQSTLYCILFQPLLTTITDTTTNQHKLFNIQSKPFYISIANKSTLVSNKSILVSLLRDRLMNSVNFNNIYHLHSIFIIFVLFLFSTISFTTISFKVKILALKKNVVLPVFISK